MVNFTNYNRNLLLIVGAVALIAYYLYNSGAIEGFVAPYFIPWWREYNRSPLYSYAGKPYYDSSWYWWPHYGQRYFDNYWRAYGIRR